MTPVPEVPTAHDPTVVHDAMQVEALLERVNQEILGKLLKNPASASELSRVLERPLKVVLYRLDKLLEVGLVTVQGERKRGGRAVKVFAPCSQRGWRFPFSLTSADTLGDLIEAALLPQMRQVVRTSVSRIRDEMWFYFWTHPELGTPSFEMRMPDQVRFQELARDMTLGFATLHMTKDDAIKLNLEQREHYFELIRRYPQPEEGTKPYTLGLFFVPDLQRVP